MAPITATSTGMQHAAIDDPELLDLIARLKAFDTTGSTAEVDVSGLVRELELWSKWKFQELADLYEWIQPLNAIDAALRQIMKQYPNLLLIAAKDPKSKKSAEPTKQAESESEANSVPSTIIHALSVLLRFLVALLRHSYNKSLFNSVNELYNLLAAADDGIAALALNVLFNLAISPLLHRMQVQETGNHTTMLHSSTSSHVHTRLMLLARGWGTRGAGLGLLDCVTFDDSHGNGGQGSLPTYAGEVDYDFIPPSSIKATKVVLKAEDIIQLPQGSSSPDYQNEKRRKMSASARTKSTVSLFFHCLINKIGGRDRIDPEKAFALLVHIRLAKAFHCRETRVRAVEHRLWALNALIYAHPSDALAGYFHAQPELCSEIADLLRPLVSSNAVSEVGAMIHADAEQMQSAAIKSIVDPSCTPSIPFEIRLLALETLNAIIFRRDDRVMTGVSTIAKQTNILSELGITKGQILGLIPTLIRYSLASLNSFISAYSLPSSIEANATESSLDIEKLNIDAGLSFLEATQVPTPPDKVGNEEKAFLFVETVLFLATTIITTTNGTPALTDCGLIPAIISTLNLSTQISQGLIELPFHNISTGLSPSSMLKYITALCIQVLEGAIVTHNPALSAFHDLKAVDLLVSLLCSEFRKTILPGEQRYDMDSCSESSCSLQASERVLLYSILNCLTIVLHHQETQTRSSTQTVSAVEVLKRPEMTDVLDQVLRNVNTFGGVLGALVVTLLTDIINSDPKVTHYIFESGLAESFFLIMKGKEYSINKKYTILDVTNQSWHAANIPCSSELIMALPNLISALCLTEDGRKRVMDANPFPDLFGVMVSPQFVMPHSRCLLNEMASIIGGSVDELIRHVPSMKSLIIEAFVRMIDRVEFLGQNVSNSEDECKFTNTDTLSRPPKSQETSRISLMHFGSNIAQLLEQILRTEDNCEPFIQFGGYRSLLRLYAHLTLRGKELLSHLSSQSSPAIANISHSTISSSFTTAFRRLAVNANPLNAVTTIKEFLKLALSRIDLSISHVTSRSHHFECSDDQYNLSRMMEGIPKAPLHLITGSDEKLKHLSEFFESVLYIEWLSQLMAAVVRIVCQRSPEWTPWRSGDRAAFLEEIGSSDFLHVMDRLSMLFRSFSVELCKMRSEDDFELRDLERWKTPEVSSSYPATYNLRIVCSDGAIVRDGIDIDSCASVGGLEMGEEILAFERCINRSGIMRYRTARGWISEQTRGHGREPIAEVIDISGVAGSPSEQLTESVASNKSSYCGITDLHSLTASILARLHSSHCNLYSSLSRVVMVGLRRSDDKSNELDHVQNLVRHIGDFLRANFSVVQNESDIGVSRMGSKGAVCLYLGNMLSMFHSCIHEERREKKQFLNIALFANMLYNDSLYQSFLIEPKDEAAFEMKGPKKPLTAFELYCSELIENKIDATKDSEFKSMTAGYDNLDDVARLKYIDKAANLTTQYVKESNEYFDLTRRHILPSSGFYGAIRTLLQFSLEEIADLNKDHTKHLCPSQTLNRTVAASLPAAISLLRKLSSQSLSIDSSMSDFIGRLDKAVFMKFLTSGNETKASKDDLIFSFRQGPLARSVHSHIGAITFEFWTHKYLRFCPAHLLYPILGLVKDAMHCLKESIDRKDSDLISQSESVIPFSLNVGNAITLSLLQNRLSNSRGGSADVEEKNESSIELSDKASKEKEDTKRIAEINYDTKSLELIADTYERLKDSLVNIGLDILYKPEDHSLSRLVKVGELNESESCSVICASFLLEMCTKYGIEKEVLVATVLDRILSCFECTEDTKHSPNLKDDATVSFASLCLTAVVLLRVLPGVRTLVSKRNLVRIMIQCVRSVTKNLDSYSAIPLWLTPVLLFLEVMAKPITLPANVFESTTDSRGRYSNEFERVCHEHKKQKALLQKTSRRISELLSQKSSTEKVQDKTASSTSAFEEIPAFAPLMTTEAADHCLMLCLKLLKMKKRVKADKRVEAFVLSADSAHATLLLLTRILLFRKVASRCLQLNGVDTLLSLPSKSRFKGHTELLTLAFRRMMEDESTLLSQMEGEMRSTVSKLIKKQLGSDTDVDVKAFLKGMTPMICRDPIIFMRAAAVTISIKQSSVTPSSEGISGKRVRLLSSEERIRNMKLMSESFRVAPIALLDAKTPLKAHDFRPSTEGLSLTPGDESFALETKRDVSTNTRRDKKIPRKDKFDVEIGMNGSFSNHIMSCICSEVVKAYEKHSKSQAEKVPFLCVHEYFEILGDLVLLIPSCAPSLYNHRMPIPGKKNHYRNVIAYFLHTILPQESDVIKCDHEVESKDKIEVEKRHRYLCLRTAQSCARTLLALVARPGEGRRKVISELSDAFSGKCTNFKKSDCIQSIKSWGELCIGLAAPKKNSNSIDSDSSLSIEVIKVMMDCGMAEAVLCALQQIDLNHPQASVTATNLLRPLEIFTRRTVVDSITELTEKERKRLSSTSSFLKDSNKRLDGDDEFLDSGFDTNHALNDEIDDDSNPVIFESSESSESSGNDDGSESSEEDILVIDSSDEEGMMSINEEESMNDSQSSDEQYDSDDSMGDVDHDQENEIESDNDVMESEDDDESIVDEDNESDEDPEGREDDDGNMNDDNIFNHDLNEENGNQDFFGEDEEIGEEEADEMEEEEMEGWTNVGHNGTGFSFESLFSASRNALPVGRPRAPAGMIEAAASFIGNILQHSEIPAHALEQLQQIGIPVSRRTLPIEFLHRNDHREITSSNRIQIDANDSVTVPAINQINLPDNGFSSAASGRSTDVNFMEYLYGGLVMGSSRMYYDLLQTAEESDNYSQYINVPSLLETELFPGGPSANTSPRLPETPHTLLAGLRLPPFNALLSSAVRNEDITPIRRRELPTDPFEGWQEVFSGSGGSIVRLSRIIDRSNSNRPVLSNAGSENIVSEGAESFGLAFERAISTFTPSIPAPESHSSQTAENRLSPQNSLREENASGASTNLSDGIQCDNTNAPSDDIRLDRSDTVLAPSETLDLNIGTGNESQVDENVENSLNRNETLEALGSTLLDSCGNDQESNNNFTNNSEGNECPHGIDPEVFEQLPLEMQQEIIREHQVSSEMDSRFRVSSALDPEALAALPEDMRLEVLEQERHNAEHRTETPADPSRAEDMDSASFIASLSPDLREEILLTADDEFLNSLPPEIRTEAQVLRERAMISHHQDVGRVAGVTTSRDHQQERLSRRRPLKKKLKSQVRVDCNRSEVIYTPPNASVESSFLIDPDSLKSLIDLMFLLSPVRPQRILQKLFQNLCYNPDIRKALAIVFIALLNDEPNYALEVIKGIGTPSNINMEFPTYLVGPPPVSPSSNPNTQFLVKSNVSSATSAIAINLPTSSRGSVHSGLKIPPVVAKRLIGALNVLTKTGSRLPVDILYNFVSCGDANDSKVTYLDTILSLIAKPSYSHSASNLEELLGVIDNICSPLECIPRSVDDVADPSPKDIEVAASLGKEYIAVPRVVVSPSMLKILCSILHFESCKDTLYGKVISIFKRLSRVDVNRKCILDELAIVAQKMGSVCIRDLRTLKIQLEYAAQSRRAFSRVDTPSNLGSASSTITLSTSTIDLKLLRVLQSLFMLDRPSISEPDSKTDFTTVASLELVTILNSIHLESLWTELTSCLNVVSFLEGVDHLKIDDDEDDKKSGDDDEVDEDETSSGKKLQSTVAGLLTRFLPTIEAFFIVNTCLAEKKELDESEKNDDHSFDRLVGGTQVVKFVSANKVLLNALLRSSPALLDKNLKAMVSVPKCCEYLDFDVKRSWFKQQVRKLRAQASRRHGSLRLNIRRPYVFEDAYRQLSLRTAEEMRGRLHVTFVNEEGVDAGGLSREFFGILAKEMFNPNYALFTSTEDGCTFQPNPNSSINREHLDYFRFVGRIVGKAVSDGFLLDAHFTRSLYKHMLGMKPTYQDMQAIDPDFYKNLKLILDYNLEDIGLDLTFSTVSHWFGRAQTIDLIPNGRNISVTESEKEKYVDLVCQHRMTTSIEKQLDAFLFGFHELVKPELIGIFNPRELELIISGMPDIDISDLKMNTEYHGWRSIDEEIGWFWNILFSLSKSDKAAFLQFVTGSSKVPLNGFSDLQGMRGTQKFSIHKAGGPEGALMSAHTCFNSLDLPRYKSEEEMREKLMYAIKEGSSGFLFA